MTYVTADKLLIIPDAIVSPLDIRSVYQYTTYLAPEDTPQVASMGPIRNGRNGLIQVGTQNAMVPGGLRRFRLKSVVTDEQCVSVEHYALSLHQGAMWGYTRVTPCVSSGWQKFEYTTDLQIRGVCVCVTT